MFIARARNEAQVPQDPPPLLLLPSHEKRHEATHLLLEQEARLMQSEKRCRQGFPLCQRLGTCIFYQEPRMLASERTILSLEKLGSHHNIIKYNILRLKKKRHCCHGFSTERGTV